MNEKTEKLSVKLANVQKNAEDSRRLIAYHKKMLKTYLRKEKALNERLKKEQLSDLYKTVREGGCDIEAINEAIKNGEFGRDITEEDEKSEPDREKISPKIGDNAVMVGTTSENKEDK